MNPYRPNKILGFLLLTILFFSCSSDLDFNQANDFKLEPVFIANLASFEIPANQFIENGMQQNIAMEAQEFDVFRDSFFRQNLRQADFFFEINNTIKRAYSIDIFFLGKNDEPVYTIHFDVPAYSETENVVKKTEFFENANLELLKSARRMRFVLTMGSGSALNANSPGILKLTSSATVCLLIE